MRIALDETTRDHLATAAENRDFALRIHGNDAAQAVDLRWAAVAAFYAGVHYVNGYLWERQQLEPGDHNERSMFVATVRELRGVNANYHRLRNGGYDARYVPRTRISRTDLADLLTDLEAVRVAVLNALQPSNTES